MPGAIRYGGDYNPEQWPREVWDEDRELMVAAGVNTATVGVFSWAQLEPRPGEFRFAWLDDVIEGLHASGIGVILATATASPPAWLARQHPESLPVTIDGTRLAFGSRQQYSPSSAAYREHATRLVRRLAERYGTHPALVAWHVGNEYGCHVPRSYDPESAAAFRGWLQRRYGTIDELNRAWGTAFWSQRYDSFDELDVPAQAPAPRNPTQVLDFDRFSSDALLGLYRAEAAILRELSPGVPITTNFMGFFKDADYWRWAQEVDIVSDDLYPDPADPRSHILAAATRDLMRSLGGGRPWLLMEQATSAVNWRERNVPKAPGQDRLHALQCVARGADGVLYFQWRQSVAGAEKFHSAMLPHAGAETRVHRGVRALGAELASLGDLVGASVPARVAIVLDWDSWRAIEQDAVPVRLDYLQTLLDWYSGFLRRGITVDFVPAGDAADGYRLVVAPLLHVADDAAVQALAAVADRGDVLVTSYLSGVLDPDLHARLGGYLGGGGSALQRVLGVRVEEFAPLPAAESVAELRGAVSGPAHQWQELIEIADDEDAAAPDAVEVIARFADGFAAGAPAITRRRSPAGGEAWYVATEPSEAVRDALVERWRDAAGLSAAFARPEPGLETVRRGARRLVGNHTAAERTVDVHGARLTLPPFGAVLIDVSGELPPAEAIPR